jgi:glutamyl-tRNA synthetase
MPPVSRTRFAPSPTGRLHLGNVRTALFNFLLARALGGDFLLRIEDTDAERSDPAAERLILEDLRWLGLEWDEGPVAGGRSGPYRQSERAAVYGEYAQRLIESGQAYPCWRTDAELKAFRRARMAAGRPPVYDRQWAQLPEEEIRRRAAAGQAPVLRFRTPETGKLEFDDSIRGPQVFGLAEIGDFVIRRSDGTPSFFFSNALDDALMEMTDVLRGEDHLSNTPRQILLLEALDLSVPRYGHLPLLMGEQGAPLSKRRGSAGMAEFRDAGLLPEAVTNYAARLGHAFESGELMDLGGLAAHFRLGKIGKAPARYDPIQLEHWQSLAVQAASDARIAEWAGEAAFDQVPAELRQRFLDWVRPNVHRPADVEGWAAILFGSGPEFTPEIEAELAETGPAFFRAALEGLAAGEHSLAAISGAVKASVGAKGRALFRPLRLALTGAEAGPELAPMLELLPEETVRVRLARWA